MCCSTAAQIVKIGKAFSHVHATYLSPYFILHIVLLTEEWEKVRDFNNLWFVLRVMWGLPSITLPIHSLHIWYQKQQQEWNAWMDGVIWYSLKIYLAKSIFVLSWPRLYLAKLEELFLLDLLAKTSKWRKINLKYLFSTWCQKAFLWMKIYVIQI